MFFLYEIVVIYLRIHLLTMALKKYFKHVSNKDVVFMRCIVSNFILILKRSWVFEGIRLRRDSCLGLKTTKKWASMSRLNLVLVSKFGHGLASVSKIKYYACFSDFEIFGHNMSWFFA